MYYSYVNKYVPYFHRKIQLSGISALPDGWSSQLIRVSGILLCYNFYTPPNKYVHYFHRKIQLSGISALPDGWSSQLIRISGILLCYKFYTPPTWAAAGI